MATTAKIPSYLRMLGIASAFVLLAACASVPPPTSLMQRTQQQLEAARDAQAADYAPVDMTFAEQRFKAAQSAMEAKKYALASDLAHEAEADARLAQTRARLAVARKEIKQRSAQNERLRKQLLSDSAPSSSGPAEGSSTNAGLPEQITLPQPADSAPAQGTSVPVEPAPTGERP